MKLTDGETLDADRITETLWCGATLDECEFEMLSSLGIKRVVNVETYNRYSPGAFARFGIDFVNIPIRDIDQPLSDKQIDRVVTSIDEVASRGGAVYLHCTAGWQRSPALAACYLVYNGLSAEEALSLVKQSRPVARFYSAHIASVMRYEKRLRGHPPLPQPRGR